MTFATLLQAIWVKLFIHGKKGFLKPRLTFFCVLASCLVCVFSPLKTPVLQSSNLYCMCMLNHETGCFWGSHLHLWPAHVNLGGCLITNGVACANVQPREAEWENDRSYGAMFGCWKLELFLLKPPPILYSLALTLLLHDKRKLQHFISNYFIRGKCSTIHPLFQLFSHISGIQLFKNGDLIVIFILFF